MPQAKSKTRPIKIVQIYFCADQTGYRIWNSAWPGDTFERVSPQTFDALKATFERFGVPIEEYFDDN